MCSFEGLGSIGTRSILDYIHSKLLAYSRWSLMSAMSKSSEPIACWVSRHGIRAHNYLLSASAFLFSDILDTQYMD